MSDLTRLANIDNLVSLKSDFVSGLQTNLTGLVGVTGVLRSANPSCCLSDIMCGEFNYVAKLLSQGFDVLSDAALAAMQVLNSVVSSITGLIQMGINAIMGSGIMQAAQGIIAGAEGLLTDLTDSAGAALAAASDTLTNLQNAVIGELGGLVSSAFGALGPFGPCLVSLIDMPDLPGVSDLSKKISDVNREVSDRMKLDISDQLLNSTEISDITSKLNGVQDVLGDSVDRGNSKASVLGVISVMAPGSSVETVANALSGIQAAGGDLNWKSVGTIVQTYTDVQDESTFNQILDTFAC